MQHLNVYKYLSVSDVWTKNINFIDGQVLSLVELSARVVAFHIPFEVVEHVCPPVPEQLQLRIAFWSFPENEEDIRYFLVFCFLYYAIFENSFIKLELYLIWF